MSGSPRRTGATGRRHRQAGLCRDKYLSTYDEEDPSQLFHRERTTQEEADRRGAIARGVFGYATLSLKLDKLLAERATQSAA
jgi:hypothetical protein